MENIQKKQNWFIRLWNYYTTYEKIWLFSIITLSILFAILFPDDPEGNFNWLNIVQIIAIIGGCSCELLLSKQSRWAFIVSFILYDTTQTIVYFASGYYISALFEIIFWIPILFICFHIWSKKSDDQNKLLTKVRQVNYQRDLLIFLGVLAISVLTGLAFTSITIFAEGMPDWWYLDALANAFSVCNGIFLMFRFKEQWLPWIGVALVEAVMWILSGQFIMLILSVGYLMNSLYGLIKWHKYTKAHPNYNNSIIYEIRNKRNQKKNNKNNELNSNENKIDSDAKVIENNSEDEKLSVVAESNNDKDNSEIANNDVKQDINTIERKN